MTAPFVIAAALAAVTSSTQAGEDSQAQPQGPSPAHIHVNHVLESINGPPESVGLLAILEQEAEVASRHAGLAASDLTNLEGMKTHSHHVRHAIDPTLEEGGPGKGYGLLRAAHGVETHIMLATTSEGSTENIERHANHVATAARNVAGWAELALAECEKVFAAETAEAAAASTQRIQELVGFMLQGTDADADGQVSWQQGEGGIPQARQHAELLARGEGMGS